ncbi:hypothetical protein CFC21_043299 [Triticum aestivum]|nr:ethylene-responsive transcription factor ERF020-like [Triticum dicoccoides]XP_044345174.1 ethylene-responsive transcription factor ERF020-like [Triticum aestivum]KAF7032077.1 hypothetical protein CFC21_043299 [Triticum aestivum]
MSSAAEASAARGGEEERCRYKGVRRRRWGKWVSEIRVPGTRERLWLGSYATPEAAAVAHDTAVYFLRGGGNGAAGLNFPERAAAAYGAGCVAPLSPRSVQSVASDAGMAADAQLVAARDGAPRQCYAEARAGAGAAQGGANARHAEFQHDGAYAYTYTGDGGDTTGGGGSRGQLVSGELSVDDMEILM